ncbi:MAG TPA: hypothetical protein VGM29_17460 [Polyangiaceae bacterium]|jgi:hypothetical protein
MLESFGARSPALAIALGCAIFGVQRPAHAYRPFDATDASVAERGVLELELGPAGYLHSGHRSYYAPTEVLNLGFWNRWELVLQGRELVPGQMAGASSRVSLVDTGVFVKHVFREGSLQGNSGISIASEFGVLLPTIQDEHSVGFSDGLIFSQQIPALSLHLNVEGGRTPAGNPDVFLSLIAEGPKAWPARPVAEFFFDREFDAHTEFSTLVGFIAPLSERVTLDGGSRLATLDGALLFEGRAGLTWAIPVWR